MPKEILIERYFPGESRVAMVENGKVITLDVCTKTKKRIRGNIYLATVSRVEPSLQAAFVDYGEERKGFLPFDSIHVNYYDLPKQDLKDLKEQVKKSAEEECAACKKLLDEIHKGFKAYEDQKVAFLKLDLSTDFVEDARQKIEEIETVSLLKKILTPWKKDELVLEEPDIKDPNSVKIFVDSVARFVQGKLKSAKGSKKKIYNNLLERTEEYLKDFTSHEKLLKELEACLKKLRKDLEKLSSVSNFRKKCGDLLRGYISKEMLILEGRSVHSSSKKEVKEILREMLGEQESMEGEMESFDEKNIPLSSYGTRFLQRKYGIQEVIKKGNTLVVQVVKGERGNKGSLLTTYLSLAGRYCIFLVNTTKKHAISRKIKDIKERQKLKKIISSFKLEPGKGIILRTAGKSRSEKEIESDLVYLIKLWNQMLERTNESEPPSLIHEDGNQLVWVIRDMYTPEVAKITVQGDDAFEELKSIAQFASPSILEKITKSDSFHPLFVQKNIEGQVANLENPSVQLKSGGYIVINSTEALTTIDVNSGQYNQAHTVEETAFTSNMEAAAEVTRQLILRDIGGLIAVDLIDMENVENIRSVERAFRDHSSKDSAKIKVLPISQLGILEMSRQRRLSSLEQLFSSQCGRCGGSGRVQLPEHKAMSLVRDLHRRVLRSKKGLKEIKVYADQAVTFHLDKYKTHIKDLEDEAKIGISFESDDEGPSRVMELHEARPAKKEVEDAAGSTPE